MSFPEVIKQWGTHVACTYVPQEAHFQRAQELEGTNTEQIFKSTSRQSIIFLQR